MCKWRLYSRSANGNSCEIYLHDDVTFFVKMADFRGAAVCVESTSGALYP